MYRDREFLIWAWAYDLGISRLGLGNTATVVAPDIHVFGYLAHFFDICHMHGWIREGRDLCGLWLCEHVPYCYDPMRHETIRCAQAFAVAVAGMPDAVAPSMRRMPTGLRVRHALALGCGSSTIAEDAFRMYVTHRPSGKEAHRLRPCRWLPL